MTFDQYSEQNGDTHRAGEVLGVAPLPEFVRLRQREQFLRRYIVMFFVLALASTVVAAVLRSASGVGGCDTDGNCWPDYSSLVTVLTSALVVLSSAAFVLLAAAHRVDKRAAVLEEVESARQGRVEVNKAIEDEGRALFARRGGYWTRDDAPK